MSTTIYTAEQAAILLGLSPRRVRALATERKLGCRVGARLLVLTAADVDAMRVRRKAGRPRQEARPDAVQG
jgi:hypothetical protein